MARQSVPASPIAAPALAFPALALALGFALVIGMAGPAFADPAPRAGTPATAAPAPDAATAFAERTALLHAVERCPLLTRPEMSALSAGAAQARGALLRGGWTMQRIEDLRARAIAAVDARACTDAALRQSVAQAQAGYAAWSRLPAMEFPGAAPWRAARAPDAQGWYLRQNGRAGAVLGVREDDAGPVVAFVAPLSAASPEPAFAVLSFRDAQLAPASLVDVPGRLGQGLAAMSASPSMAREVWASDRRIEVGEDGRRIAVLTFPLDAFSGVEALDPREAIEVRLGRRLGETGVRLYFEVGDLAAAQAFLAATPGETRLSSQEP